ncbi:aldo/keto reductase [Aureitalea marina]|nr:aldo/keto reductase [Aureitalea marina]
MTWGIWGKDLSTEQMASRIEHALDLGITSFDHADIYGDYTTEAAFGEAFKASGIDRSSMEIITKCGIQYVGNTRQNVIKHYQYDADYIVWSAEKSIADLQCDYLDLFLLHRPSPLMHPEEVQKAADRLLSEGKIRSFGVSNFTNSQSDLIASKTAISANQIEFSLVAHQAMLDGSLDYMKLNGIVPMCWSPLGGVFKDDNEQTDRIKSTLEELCPTYDAAPDQLLLAWIMKLPAAIHPVIGTTDPKRMKQAMEATEIQLSEIDWFKLWVASTGHKVP